MREILCGAGALSPRLARSALQRSRSPVTSDWIVRECGSGFLSARSMRSAG